MFKLIIIVSLIAPTTIGPPVIHIDMGSFADKGTCMEAGKNTGHGSVEIPGKFGLAVGYLCVQKGNP